ncbi:NAD(P)/FAD-dependent oxidoreductase [Leptodesmis sp.]|uniref:NAD(P)/FAD-dependent oxidoreductase n=1 Tax=Leptodesmis sp. TaxID=3100501 RepID=UPI00405355DD
MNKFDWIVVGGGITGTALAYELANQGLSVLLLEQDVTLQGASRYGYGGIAYWAGTTELTRQLCAEGIAIHRSLADELESDPEFRELDLVLTVPPDADIPAIAQSYQAFAIPPQYVERQQACELEPLLNPAAISGAFTVRHGHVNLGKLVEAYRQAFIKRGGTLQIETAMAVLEGDGKQVQGIQGRQNTYSAKNIAICTGALTRLFLRQAGIAIAQYFTHAELIETPPLDIKLRSLVMPAQTRRFQLEARASQAEIDSLWDHPGHEPVPAILDAGAIQFLDGRMRLGQISRALTDPFAPLDAAASETAIRTQVGAILPALQDVPGTWHHCLIAFSRDSLPLIGPIADWKNLHLFSGFSNPLAIVPALARRFAKQATIAKTDPLLKQLLPNRFG